MLGKIKSSIDNMVRVQRGEGDQFFTHDGKQKLIETKVFFKKYTRLIAGLFISVISVSIAFMALIYGLIMKVILPLVNSSLLDGGLQINMGKGQVLQLEQPIGFALIFVVVYIMAWAVIRKLSGGIELAKEERTMRCPMCGEQILNLAIKCKHCGSTVGRDRTQTFQSGSRDFSPQERTRRPQTRQRSERSSAPPPRKDQSRRPERRPERSDSTPSSTEDRGERPPRRSSSSRRSSPPRSRSKTGRYHSRRERPGNEKSENRGPDTQ